MPHWKDHLDSSLLGAYSLFDDKTEGFKQVEGMILRCEHQEHILGQTGKKKIHVAITNLGKPMKLNVVISKQLELITKFKNPVKWVNVPVIFYVDENVSFGKQKVEAIRIKANPNKPFGVVVPKIDLEVAKKQLEACTTIAELQQVYTSKGFPTLELVKLKDELKTKLS